MRQKFVWTKVKRRAATLVADDALGDEVLAAQLGIARCTLNRWKDHPDFKAEVASILAAYREQIVAEGIANRQNRVDALNDRHHRMVRVIEERAEDPDMEDIPGGTTGLMVRQRKQIGAGRDAQVIEEFAVDTVRA